MKWSWNASQNMVKFMTMKGPCHPHIGTCHLPLQGLNYESLQLLTFNTPERSSGWRSEMRHSVLWKKTGRRGLQIVRYFQETILWAQFLHLFISRSTKILHCDVCSLWLAVTFTKLVETFYKTYVLDCMYAPFTKITYILTLPPPSL